MVESNSSTTRSSLRRKTILVLAGMTIGTVGGGVAGGVLAANQTPPSENISATLPPTATWETQTFRAGSTGENFHTKGVTAGVTEGAIYGFLLSTSLAGVMLVRPDEW